MVSTLYYSPSTTPSLSVNRIVSMTEESLYDYLTNCKEEVHNRAMRNPFLLSLMEGINNPHGFCAKAYVYYLCNLFVLHEAIENLQRKIINQFGEDYFVFPSLFRSEKILHDIRLWSVFNPAVAQIFSNKNLNDAQEKKAFIEHVQNTAEESAKAYINELKKEPLLLVCGALFALYGTAMSGGQFIKAGVQNGFSVRIEEYSEKNSEEIAKLPQILQDIVKKACVKKQYIEEIAEESVSLFDFGRDFSFTEFKEKWHNNLNMLPSRLGNTGFTKDEFKKGVSRVTIQTMEEFLKFIRLMLEKLANEKVET